ncbi:potassium channel family protein [Arenimonas sp. MALMAid1274]|uniref:potassium channel family protein n=1 Tax=Arenimonas sp. MALMAid1274 TaxID=3411630 RepID=UPI003BA3BD6F
MATVFLHRVARLPNAWLLLSLITLVVLYPFLEPFQGGRAAIAAFDLMILFSALRAARATGPEARIGYVLVWPAIALHIAAAFYPTAWLVPANLATQAAFHAFVVVCLLRYMLRDEVMTLDELFAAAGLYVLMAFVFAYLYALVETFSPGAFFINPANNPDGMTRWWELLYFSFTCLTSVGFGEITPVSDHARSLVMIQQMLGVLYIALVISRLVAMQASRRR